MPETHTAQLSPETGQEINRIAMPHSEETFDTRSDLKAADRAWVTGLAGVITVVFSAVVVAFNRGIKNGLSFGTVTLTTDQNTAVFYVLALTASVMVLTELLQSRRRAAAGTEKQKKALTRLSPGIIRDALMLYLVELGLFYAVIIFYQSAAEYNAGRYSSWFTVLEHLFKMYLYGGFFYHLLTKIYRPDTEADRKSPGYVVLKTVLRPLHRAGVLNLKKLPPAGFDRDSDCDRFTRSDRTALLALVVKIFFLPLMTAFFAEQFYHMQKNILFIYERLQAVNVPLLKLFTAPDFFNISVSIIFSIDVAIAWSGYLLASRWLNNHYTSVEPTLSGWLVAVISYPPFNRFFDFYYSAPGEQAFFKLGNDTVVTLMALLAVASFSVYLVSTVVFGLRFSNLTHRGIIRTGFYRYVRHPAYASKNFSWWFLMFPYALYEIIARDNMGGWSMIAGLILLSTIYYWRAITEERHLLADTAYREYMNRVRYRFIPGLV